LSDKKPLYRKTLQQEGQQYIRVRKIERNKKRLVNKQTNKKYIIENLHSFSSNTITNDTRESSRKYLTLVAKRFGQHVMG